MGQAVLTRTILREVPDVERIIADLGGGGLACGLGVGLMEAGRSDVELIGIQVPGSDAYEKSLAEGSSVRATEPNPDYPGMCVSESGEWNRYVLSSLPNFSIHTVPDEQVRALTDHYVQEHVDMYGPSLKGVKLFEATSMPAFAALTLKQFQDRKKTVVVGTGRNDCPSSLLKTSKGIEVSELKRLYPYAEFDLDID